MEKSGLEVFLDQDAQNEQKEFLEEEKTTSEIVSDTLSVSNLSHGIRGLREVKQELVDVVTKAAFLSKQGYIPMVLLIGPSGSGKTAFVEAIKRLYYNRIKTEEKIYTLEINGKTCLYKENAYNLMRSSLPFSTKNAKFWSFRRGPELCAFCMTNLEKLVSQKMDAEAFPIGGVKFVQTFPQTATMQMNDEYMPDKFYNIAKNANRGLLLISADKSKLSSVSPRTYQFLVNLYDNTLSDMSGNRVPLDMLVVLNSNEEFFEALGSKHTAETQESGSKPLKERLLVVRVRRNLSYSEEENIYKGLKLPINRTFPNALMYLAKANVLSRINLDSFKTKRERLADSTRSSMQFPTAVHLQEKIGDPSVDRIDKVLTLLDMYETGSLRDNKKMTNALLNSLEEGDPYENIKNILKPDREYESGWETGLSSRMVTNQLCTREAGSFNFSDLNNYLSENAENGITDVKHSYLGKLITADVMSKMDYGILAYNFRSYSNDPEKLKKSLKLLEEYLDFLAREELNKAEDRKFNDPESIIPTLSDYIDISALKNNYNKYKERYAPIESDFKTDFMQLMEFIYRHDSSSSIIKRDDKIDKELYDKKSDTYKFMQSFMAKQFGYDWDECFREALSIYKNKNIKSYDI